MSRKVLQIGYEPERDRLTLGWLGYSLVARVWMCCSQIGSMEAHGGLYPSSTMMRDGICLGILVCLRWACGHVKDRTKL